MLQILKHLIIWIIIIGSFIALQFIPVSLSNPPLGEEIPLTKEAEIALKNACWDCHSNETQFSWYTKIAPVSFLVQYQVNNGRKHLNFSEWEKYSEEAKLKKMYEIDYVLNKKLMPPSVYTMIHQKAILNNIELENLHSWTIQVMEFIEDNSNK